MVLGSAADFLLTFFGHSHQNKQSQIQLLEHLKYIPNMWKSGTWMSQEGTKRLVSGLYPQSIPFLNRLKPIED